MYPAVLKRVNEAQSSIKIMMFVMKANYGTPNIVDALIEALIAAAARGVIPAIQTSQ